MNREPSGVAPEAMRVARRGFYFAYLPCLPIFVAFVIWQVPSLPWWTLPVAALLLISMGREWIVRARALYTLAKRPAESR